VRRPVYRDRGRRAAALPHRPIRTQQWPTTNSQKTTKRFARRAHYLQGTLDLHSMSQAELPAGTDVAGPAALWQKKLVLL
jgi:hypothetical protein